MSQARPLAQLLERARAGDRGATARLLSVVERAGADSEQLEQLIAGLLGGACSVGITGAPGAGKSTLAAALARHAREDGERLAILAIDPSSPLSHGAILGDRVRMQQHASDPGIFIRSMATRGHQGGLALAATAAMRVFDACGWPWIMIETVGIGQVEVDVASAADTVVVVLNPGWGDEIQASKAGLMEVADIFVINKADRQGLEQTRRDIEGALAGMPPAQRPAIVETVATEGRGVAQLWSAINAHRARLQLAGALPARRRRRLERELERLLLDRLQVRLRDALHAPASQQLLDRVAAGQQDLVSTARAILARLGL